MGKKAAEGGREMNCDREMYEAHNDAQRGITLT